MNIGPRSDGSLSEEVQTTSHKVQELNSYIDTEDPSYRSRTQRSRCKIGKRYRTPHRSIFGSGRDSAKREKTLEAIAQTSVRRS